MSRTGVEATTLSTSEVIFDLSASFAAELMSICQSTLQQNRWMSARFFGGSGDLIRKLKSAGQLDEYAACLHCPNASRQWAVANQRVRQGIYRAQRTPP